MAFVFFLAKVVTPALVEARRYHCPRQYSPDKLDDPMEAVALGDVGADAVDLFRRRFVKARLATNCFQQPFLLPGPRRLAKPL